MDAFLALLEHVHSQMTTTYHNTPILLMASPQWTRPDHEAIARYIFEKTKTPALCLIHSGLATQYGLKWPNMTVVDIGYEKVDVTCIYDGRIVSQKNVGPRPGVGGPEETDISGGEVFTRSLLKLLESKGFNYDMAEQLKRSNICEVLPYAPEHPDLMEIPPEIDLNAPNAPQIVEPGDDVDTGADTKEVEDGVLDVANIVASGQTREFLAKREREKAEREAAKKKKGKDKEAGSGDAPPKPVKLPNSKRYKNIFHYEELVTEEVPVQPSPPPPPPAATDSNGDVTMADAAPAENKEGEQASKPEGEQPKAEGEQPKTEGEQPKTAEESSETKPEEAADSEKKLEEQQQQSSEQKDGQTEQKDQAQPQADQQQANGAAQQTERITRRVRRDIEVGPERFQFASRREIDRIATAIYRAIQSIDDIYMRPALWENIVFVGNGARIRGLKDNIIQTLTHRYLISPSSASMFVGDLPSNIGTPSGTGSQTPNSAVGAGGPPHQLPGAGAGSGVNPLLQAATTAAAAQSNLTVPGQTPGGDANNAGGGTSQSFHSQTPTVIKTAQLPTYLSEWSKHGFEEAMFLGSLVAARLAFCIHNLDAQGLEAQKGMSLTRVDYK